MYKIFSYGTLWMEDVQKRVFGRTFKVDMDLDYISGWDIVQVKMYGEYYKIAVKGDESMIVSGAIVYIPKKYIKLVDEYEGLEYERITIKTLTGNDCEIYVKRYEKTV